MTTQLFETVTVETEGMTVSLLVWRRYKKPMPGLVERIFHTNRELAESGAELPVGTVVRMPVETVNEDSQVDQVLEPIRLW